MTKQDEKILSDVVKDILKRDDLEGADEVTTLSMKEIVENSITSYIKLKKKANRQRNNRYKRVLLTLLSNDYVNYVTVNYLKEHVEKTKNLSNKEALETVLNYFEEEGGNR